MRPLVLLLVFLTLITSGSPTFAADYTYSNPRFGTTITFPNAIFTKADPEPENGDGQRWRATDGGELAVWGEYNALDFTPISLADFIAKDIDTVTYRKVGARWMVVSGFDGELIVYHRAEFGSQGVIHTMELRYPAALSQHYDRLAGKIADSLIGP